MALKNERVLCFVPTHNVEGKKDVTGAFLPEANAFIAASGGSGKIVAFDNSKSLAARRKEVLNYLTSCGPTSGYTSVAFFCHGWLNGIQAGFQRRHVGELAAAIAKLIHEDDVIVPLYCCSTGKDEQDDPLTAAGTGDDSFADKLRDAMCAEGIVQCRVMGHTTVAHTTKNPMVLFMDGMGVPEGGVGGYPPVSPKSANWKKWKKALQTTDLRFRMPYMTAAEIHAELTSQVTTTV